MAIDIGSDTSPEPAQGDPTAADDPAQPQLRVVRGTPTAEELAVLTALVAAATDGDSSPAIPPLRGRWSDPAWSHRRPLRPGPGAWAAALR